jgi:acetyltransferase-like isoleucine patch superfamily enzyme
MIRNNIKISGDSNLTIGENCFINSYTLFDLSDNIDIGTNVVVGGRLTEFWTHSYNLKREILIDNIKIGSNIYFGSGCLINKGVEIASNNIVGAKTVVSKSITNENNLIASNKLTIIKRKN